MNSNAKILLIVGAAVLIIGTFAAYFLMWPQLYSQLFPRCPASCDDGNSCTTETCSESTGYQCEIKNVPNCCGNKNCELSEKYETCAADCPLCDDNNKCTKDYFDYNKQQCVSAPITDAVCCGNTVCEVGEDYQACAKDCPSCDDNNKCTRDFYDYHKGQCVNETIANCCGNNVCEAGVEQYSSCGADCPNCDDANKLTADSFNYKTQKCSNIVTHYFIDNFEGGSSAWSFYNAVDAGPTSAWTLIREGANTVLQGVNHNFADLTSANWDNYIFKLKFKKVSGSVQINFRNNFFMPVEIAHRYIIRLEEDGRHISLAKGLNESKGQYQELADGYASFASGWHTLELRAYNNIFNIYVDGNLLIKYKDAQNPFLSGKINFETGDNTIFLFDNVEVKLISAQDVVHP